MDDLDALDVQPLTFALSHDFVRKFSWSAGQGICK